MEEVRIIKGPSGGPDGKWEEVQAIQHEPFIFIQYNGSRWLGQEEGDIPELLDMLAKYKLQECYSGENCYSVDVCRGIENPEYHYGSDKPHFIDGPRMYACDGVVRFHGNFEEYSHAFGIDTNHKPTIDALIAAIKSNAENSERYQRLMAAKKAGRSTCPTSNGKDLETWERIQAEGVRR